MSLKDLFLIFRKHEYEKEIIKKLSSLEMNIEELEQALKTLKERGLSEKGENTREPPIIIEKINIEKIILDKYELNNNFGQLGIKELKGKLNIGATYGSEFTPNMNEDKKEEEKEREERMKKAPPEKGPKVNIQAKKEEKKD